jgi:hypothetical protein
MSAILNLCQRNLKFELPLAAILNERHFEICATYIFFELALAAMLNMATNVVYIKLFQPNFKFELSLVGIFKYRYQRILKFVWT